MSEREGIHEGHRSAAEVIAEKFAEKLAKYSDVKFDEGRLVVNEGGVKELADFGITAKEGDAWNSFTYSDEDDTTNEVVDVMGRAAIHPETGDIVDLGHSIGTAPLRPELFDLED
ncbi:hypothetical protein HY626_03590 [Candidatus Uhrbacteria bacterium]|nr:hypothetical protein [Candidatus Uhrbacteria bacterium]